jgi:hypothetical protein
LISRVGHCDSQKAHDLLYKRDELATKSNTIVHTGILRASRHESISTFYNHNTFHFAHVYADKSFRRTDWPITRCAEWAKKCDSNVSKVNEITMEMNMDYQGFCHDFYPGDSADSKIDILPLPGSCGHKASHDCAFDLSPKMCLDILLLNLVYT